MEKTIPWHVVVRKTYPSHEEAKLDLEDTGPDRIFNRALKPCAEVVLERKLADKYEQVSPMVLQHFKMEETPADGVYLEACFTCDMMVKNGEDDGQEL